VQEKDHPFTHLPHPTPTRKALAGLGTALEKLDKLDDAAQCLERCLDAHPYAAHLPTFLQALLRKLDAERLQKVQKILLATEAAAGEQGADGMPLADADETPKSNTKTGTSTITGRRSRREDMKGMPRRHGGKVATTATSTSTTGKDGKPHEEDGAGWPTSPEK